MNTWMVLVANVGTVYHGPSPYRARRAFWLYATAGRQATLTRNGEIVSQS